ncbi:MAG: WhiB family transcriptional regulator [Actinobacteria bacterium]|nr:WhiB family transcriptional regulator [Actinomycetota bacterium]
MARPAPVRVISRAEVEKVLTRAWTAQAACTGSNTDLFFPERGRQAADAKAVCRTCSVADDCLTYALVQCENSGVWGGISERERRRMRARTAIECASCAICGAAVLPPRTVYCSDRCSGERRSSEKTRAAIRAEAEFVRVGAKETAA